MFIYNKSYLNLEDLLFFGVCRLGILIPELFRLPKNIAKNHLFTPFPASVTAINTKTQKHFSRIKKLSKSKSWKRVWNGAQEPDFLSIFNQLN